MPIKPVLTYQYKAVCDICKTVRPYLADDPTGACIVAESCGGWEWTIRDTKKHKIALHCDECKCKYDITTGKLRKGSK